jgi:hypothetical protein
MLKRILLIMAMGVALVACSPSGSGTSPGTETVAPPAETSAPSEVMPSESPAAS